jgi:hypothetical protein
MRELPFNAKNRPWLTSDCIEGMNEQWMACLSKMPEHYRDTLAEWAAVKVEMGACKDEPEISERCLEWGDKWVAEQMRKQPAR